MKIIVIAVFTISIVLDIFSGMLGLGYSVAALLPCVYLGLSFCVFKDLVLGFRIFHVVCVGFICVYYVFGLILNCKDILFGGTLEAMLAYSWFSSLSITYLVFCAMLGVLYFPYWLYGRLGSDGKSHPSR
ncbi:MAG TPA: hypothetical protein VF268_02770 [Gammaproteobacteria bacterium]|jgi:hypothetical protein